MPKSPKPKTDKPNILVIWGDDIGIANLSCYSHGLMGYQTPNIDRLAKEGMMFTDSYGEQSCTAGRSSFITGQSVYRTGLSKVGIPGAPIGMNEKIITIVAALKNQGYATGQFGKNHLGDLNSMLPTNHGFDEFYGNLYHLNAEEEPEAELSQDVRPARRHALLRDGHRRFDRAAPLGQGRKAEDRGYRPSHEEAHGDLRRRLRRAGQGIHEKGERRGQAVLRLAQHHPHARLHPHQAKKLGSGGTLAITLSRHDDRP
jgi:arylsulfatase A-like enzyme